MSGYLQFVLHAHLPFIRHPEHEFHIEERWLFEAISETYIPLLDAFERLDRDGVPGRITVSLSQPLIAMLDDQHLQERFVRHLRSLKELGEKEVQRTAADERYHNIAKFYRHRFAEQLDRYENVYRRDIASAFKRFHESGRIELITCVGTHGFMPLMLLDGSRAGQVHTAADQFAQRFGFRSRGMWMGECAYTEGVDRHLADAGVHFSFVGYARDPGWERGADRQRVCADLEPDGDVLLRSRSRVFGAGLVGRGGVSRGFPLSGVLSRYRLGPADRAGEAIHPPRWDSPQHRVQVSPRDCPGHGSQGHLRSAPRC